MTSRERVRNALEHKPVDRVPVDIGGTPFTSMHVDAFRRYKERLAPELPEELMMLFTRTAYIPGAMRKMLGSDCCPIYPPLSAPKERIVTDAAGQETYVDEWGCKWGRPKDGLYYEVMTHPLMEVETAEEVDEQMTVPEDLDAAALAYMAQQAQAAHTRTDAFVILNCPQNGGLLTRCAWLMGYEDYLVNIAQDPELVAHIVRKAKDALRRYLLQTLGSFGQYIDGLIVADDLGTQIGPTMRPETYRTWFKPIWKELIQEVRAVAPHVKIIMHSCGSIKEFFPDFVEIGVDALNPVQISARGMGDLEELKRAAEGKLAFWGGACNNQGTLEFAAPSDVADEVYRNAGQLGPTGLVLGSIQTVQVSAPEENVEMLYEAMQKYGSR